MTNPETPVVRLNALAAAYGGTWDRTPLDNGKIKLAYHFPDGTTVCAQAFTTADATTALETRVNAFAVIDEG